MSAPSPSHFIAIDLEGSGFKTRGTWGSSPVHKLNSEQPDCILEVGFVVLDANTLETVDEGWSAVVPPGITTVEAFDEWCEALKVYNAYVFDMHTKNGLLDFIRAHVRSASDRSEPKAHYAADHPPSHYAREVLSTVSKVEADLVARFAKLVTKVEPAKDGRAHLHQGNSPLTMLGNSIAKYDVPMIETWMPKLNNILSYRIMDVSQMRMFYNDVAKVQLPDGLNEYIKSGGGKEAVHRAFDDARHCAHAFRRLVGYGRDVAARVVFV